MHARFLAPCIALAAVLTVAAGGALAARDAAPTPVPVDAVDGAYVMPAVLKGPVVALRLRNRGTELHEFSLGRIAGSHGAAEVVKALEAGRHVPWLKDVGGPGIVTPGASFTYTRALRPGRYVFLDGIPDHAGVSHVASGMVRVFTVAPGGSSTTPVPDVVITAGKKAFTVPSIHAGTQTIELRNRAGAERGFELATLNPGKTQADVERWTKQIEGTGKQPRGRLPMTLLGASQTIPSGTSVFVTVKLDAGRAYHVSDDESGAESTFTPR